MSDKMREEFEAWFDNKHKTDNESLNFVIREAMFDAWKASRAALCVELPLSATTWPDGTLLLDREKVEEAIDAAGVLYK